MSNVARNHKDNVFCLLYKEKKNLLSLYNAVNGTSYEREEDLEVVTLEEAICMIMRNDAAFVKKIRDKRAAEIKLEEAVRQAVEECISEDILADFFRENKEIIMEMGIFVMMHNRCGAETLVFTQYH